MDVLSNRRLQATLLALRTVDKDVRARVRQTTRQALAPDFTRQMAERTASSNQPRLQGAVLVRTARIVTSDQNIRMKSAASTRRLSGGLQPSVHGKAIEFGSNRNKDTRYSRRSPKGKRHTVTRNAQNQLPTRRQKGWAFYPAVNDLSPRFLALWVQTAIRTVHEAWEGKR
ncbi:hypothetical protein LG314_07925 [Agrococcus terreus]|uniref:hypothetical protein n=1 Tax=Agrococcus terreus TaxID=574649 RepID=UPI00384DC822